jgi:predicted nucleic acid-binding protein
MIVLDSSFLIAYHNTRDAHHAAAARTMVQVVSGKWGRALLLEYVLLEVVTVLRAKRGHEAAVRVAAALLDAAEVDFVPCSDFVAETLRTFGSEPANLSFTDAAIVTVARRGRNTPVATFDSDFSEVPGIHVVPAAV